jgi:signal transduction histidine kinase
MPGDVLEETLELMKDILNSKAIRVIKNIESSHPVEGFPNEFKQVLINLITNSQEVLLDRRVDDPWILFRLHESGGKLFLSVTDNGGGIEKDEYEKIFERNFTTKANGSGLGLYMSRLVIEKHWGGTLEFRPGEDGAIFEITLTPVFP